MTPTPSLPPIINRLARIVDGSGLERQAVAERAGMSPSALSRLLSGRRNPSIESVERVLVACGATWADLD
jgi:transcriptional regulator with XRE-family HTH domain